MQLRRCIWVVLLVVILHITSTTPVPFRSDDYFYLDSDMDDDMDYLQSANVADTDYQPNDSESDYLMFPRSAETTTECETEPPPKHVEAHTHTSHGVVATTCVAIIPGQSPTTTTRAIITTPQPTTTTPAPTTTTTTTTTHAPRTTAAPTTHAATTTTTCIPEVETTTCTEDEPTQKPAAMPYPYMRPVEATTCISVKSLPGGAGANGSYDGALLSPSSLYPPAALTEQEGKTRALHSLVQHLYVAQARVQLEAIEIKKAQAVANSAQQQLEEAANHVRSVTAALQNAQQEVASAAIRAQTAQLQLAAHDQLLFAARQDVDALSSQMVGLQAAEGIAVPTVKFDIGSLLDKLKQPLAAAERPTAVPPVLAMQEQQLPAEPAPLYVDYDYD
ncbi:mucin-5AC [Zeugodacus cucurbitae]|uniref:mucin-5AC n=1 Tax=Zeugodacus cucurbitae TaxID=28588 RepID=UPI0023D949C1|nr:mucin-5AC [Zeugodacus cucurbitae]